MTHIPSDRYSPQTFERNSESDRRVTSSSSTLQGHTMAHLAISRYPSHSDSLSLPLRTGDRADLRLHNLLQRAGWIASGNYHLSHKSVARSHLRSPLWNASTSIKGDHLARGKHDIDSNQCLELLHPFISVKDLYLSKNIVLRVAPALQELSAGIITNILTTSCGAS